MATALPVFPEFNLRDPSNLAARWEKYLKRFNNLMTAMNITDAGRKRALLLHYVGEEVNDIFDTLADKGDDNEFKEACDALTKYFTPTKNVSFEIFKFRNLKHESHETVDDFHTRLQIAAKYCEFGDNKDKEIKAQIELGTINKKLRRYSFRTPALSLTEILNYARTLHETEKQAKGIEGVPRNSPKSCCDNSADDVHKVQSERPNRQEMSSNKRFQQPRKGSYTQVKPPVTLQSSKRCFRCGYSWPHNGGKCPAEGQRCSNCFKYNHFAKVCNSRDKKQNQNSANAVQNDAQDLQSTKDEDSTDSEEYSFSVYKGKGPCETSTNKQNKQLFHTKLKLGKSTIRFQIDSGSSANIIDEHTFSTIQKENPSIKLKK
ncbi:uncharacterized protein LOC114540276 [Dendronephthya gigantea]|uniref:uncharacterized protein LOC114540276 n=1 Tax=Dendronephthya gigantea TaxID=151771 RepID=UPI0010690ABF|nr:uncharacterized protein LOC114540276 [Dendronephthya gigantea]